MSFDEVRADETPPMTNAEKVASNFKFNLKLLNFVVFFCKNLRKSIRGHTRATRMTNAVTDLPLVF